MKELSAELHRQGHHVIVVSGTNDIGIEEDIRFEKIPLPSLNPVVLWKDLRILHKIIKDNDIDVVHCHHRMAALYMRAYTLLWKVPVVYTLHAANIPSDFLHRMMTFPGDKAIGVSSEVSQFMINQLRIPEERVVTVLNGVDEKKLFPLNFHEVHTIKKAWNIADGKIVFALHSRIDEIKNHMLVVDAVRQLPSDVRDKVVFLCSGERQGTYYERILEAIRSYGLENQFIFVGWTATRELLGVSDYLVLPSRSEGFPLAVCEAFLMQKPVFRTQTGGFRDQRYCFPIDMDDPAPLMDCIVKICEGQTSEYQQQVQKAYIFAMENFTLPKMAENTVNVYRSVVKNGHGSECKGSSSKNT